MEPTLIHADIFFFIATIGFVLVLIFFLVAVVYLIRLFKSVLRITRSIESGMATIGDTAKEFVFDLRDSALFSLLFGRTRKRKK